MSERGMETVRDTQRQPVLLLRLRVAPEPPEPSLVYSQPSLPSSTQGRDSIPSTSSHPLYFLFSSQPLVPTDNRKKMKAGKGALLRLSLSLPAYFSGFILVVWPCLSLSYYFCSLLPRGAHGTGPPMCKYCTRARTFTYLHVTPICTV